MASAASSPLQQLRQRIAGLEGRVLSPEISGALPFQISPLDVMLGGGLALGALHEIAPASPVHYGAAAGFALALASRARTCHGGDVVWVETPFAAAEAGRPYGPGLAAFGLPMERFVLVRAPRPRDILWATEEALACRGTAAVIATLTQDSAVDLTASRRLALAARAHGGLGLLLQPRPAPQPSAAETRWTIAAAASRPDAFGGLGRTAFTLSLVKNRRGPCGRWTIAWDHHERSFFDPALSRAVAAATSDRPDRAQRIASRDGAADRRGAGQIGAAIDGGERRRRAARA
jgi:protein ImuA